MTTCKNCGETITYKRTTLDSNPRWVHANGFRYCQTFAEPFQDTSAATPMHQYWHDGKQMSDILDVFVLERGDLLDKYARDQLLAIIEDRLAVAWDYGRTFDQVINPFKKLPRHETVEDTHKSRLQNALAENAELRKKLAEIKKTAELKA